MNSAIELIRHFEGCKLEAYIPPEGDENGLAIGYGYTRKWVEPGCIISQAWAEQLLADELAAIRPQILKLIGYKRLPANKLEALLSFVYNIGIGQFAASTMLRKIKAGDLVGAAAEFDKWNKSNGKVLWGLVRRRAAERALFQKDQLV